VAIGARIVERGERLADEDGATAHATVGRAANDRRCWRLVDHEMPLLNSATVLRQVRSV
jgi:hypothetical protein